MSQHLLSVVHFADDGVAGIGDVNSLRGRADCLVGSVTGSDRRGRCVLGTVTAGCGHGRARLGGLIR